MSRFPLLVEFALATLTIALNGRNNIFAALKYWNCAVNLRTRPLRRHAATSLSAEVVGQPALAKSHEGVCVANSLGRLIGWLRAALPLETAKRGANRVAWPLYRWTLLEGQKPGSPVIKGIATTRAPDFQTSNFEFRRRLFNSCRLSPLGDATSKSEPPGYTNVGFRLALRPLGVE
jgi:hypothetical protein